MASMTSTNVLNALDRSVTYAHFGTHDACHLLSGLLELVVFHVVGQVIVVSLHLRIDARERVRAGGRKLSPMSVGVASGSSTGSMVAF